MALLLLALLACSGDKPVDTGSLVLDADGDGYNIYVDCDGVDDDDAADTSIEEECNNGEDDNCNGSVDDCQLTGERTLDDADAWFEGTTPGEYAGIMGPPADLNGDGIGDVLVATCVDSLCTGLTYVVPGPLIGRIQPEDVFATLNGIEADSYPIDAWGTDLDGEGAADLVLGRESTPSGSSLVDVFLGPVTGSLNQPEADLQLLANGLGDGAASNRGVHLGDLDMAGRERGWPCSQTRPATAIQTSPPSETRHMV